MDKQKVRIPDVEMGQEFLQKRYPKDTMARDYWERFARSGSVVDYLNYAAVSRGEIMPEDIK